VRLAIGKLVCFFVLLKYDLQSRIGRGPLLKRNQLTAADDEWLTKSAQLDKHTDKFNFNLKTSLITSGWREPYS